MNAYKMPMAHVLLIANFPDFDTAYLPEIPEGFEDGSWHNDCVPMFYDRRRGLCLQINYASPEARWDDWGSRYLLCRYSEEDGHGDTVIQSDDWNEILAAIARVG